MSDFFIMKKNILPLIFLLAFSQNVYSGYGGNVRGGSFGHNSGGRSAVGHNSGGHNSGHLGGGSAMHSVANYVAQNIPSVAVQSQPNIFSAVGQQVGTVANQQVGANAVGSLQMQQPVGQNDISYGGRYDKNDKQYLSELISKIDTLLKNIQYLKQVIVELRSKFMIDKRSSEQAVRGFIYNQNIDIEETLFRADGTIMHVDYINNDSALINPLTGVRAVPSDIKSLKIYRDALFEECSALFLYIGLWSQFVWTINTYVKDLDINVQNGIKARNIPFWYNGHSWLRYPEKKYLYGLLDGREAAKAQLPYSFD